MTEIDSRLEKVVHEIADACVANEKYFSDLDSVVGDGDFGFSLARGFEIVLENWDEYDRSTPATFLQKVAVTMSSRIGGTSGPIWGTAFLRAAGAIKGKSTLNGADVVAMLRAAIEGIKARGGASLGDKTLLDALVPLTDAIETALGDGLDTQAVIRAGVDAARAGADSTVQMQAMRGRASYTGERSIGSPDPGAVAVALISERIAKNW